MATPAIIPVDPNKQKSVLPDVVANLFARQSAQPLTQDELAARVMPPAPVSADLSASLTPDQQQVAAEPPDPIKDLVQGSQPNTLPTSVPQKKKGMSLGQKIGIGLQMLGAVGGGMEAAGNRGNAPGAERLMAQENAAANRALEEQKLQQVEVPKAQAYSDYMSGRNDTTQNVANTRANATTTAATTRANAATDVATINANSRNQIAALQQGAGMMITPQMAQVAGQPQYANQVLSGKSLANFMKVFTATGAAIHDLGDEGLWAVDRMGNRIHQVSVSSPSVARAREFAQARAANTPVNVIRMDDNGKPYVTAISQSEQLKTGEPSQQADLRMPEAPTTQSRNMSQMAATVTPHLDVLKKEIQDLAPYLGPVMGRWDQFLAGKVGSTGNPVLDAKMGQLMSDLKLASSAVGRTHFAGRTGLPASQYFEQLFNMARSPEELQGVLTSVPQYIEGYANMSNFVPNRPANSNNAPAKKSTTPSQSSQFKVGQTVTIKGKQMKITAVHPDGTFDAQ